MNVLTSLKQLEGKTIKHIKVEEGMDVGVFILTEDKAVALLTIEERTSYGTMSFKSNLVNKELDMFMQMEEELLKYGVINEDSVAEYNRLIEEENKKELEERLAAENERDFKLYLKLKEKFEVTYKL